VFREWQTTWCHEQEIPIYQTHTHTSAGSTPGRDEVKMEMWRCNNNTCFLDGPVGLTSRTRHANLSSDILVMWPKHRSLYLPVWISGIRKTLVLKPAFLLYFTIGQFIWYNVATHKSLAMASTKAGVSKLFFSESHITYYTIFRELDIIRNVIFSR